METNIKILGWSHIIMGGITLLLGLSLLLLLIGGSLFIFGPRNFSLFMTLIGIVIGGFLTLVAAPGIVVGIGLLNLKSWARVMALIIAFFYLFEFPLGTVLSAYTFYILLNEKAAMLFLRE